ncbi:MAG: hypothetical protein IJ565_02960 [Bacilli bacterium]|nr:hypothetical protein [Bacilli bacterium]
MGKYHNKLDKKYFNKSIYIKKFESAFNIKIKDYPLQYELIFETYNTYISLNNILFSLNYIPINQKVDNIMHLINAYLNKYKNKIKKCYDSECILIYDSLENTLDELNEMKELYTTKKTKYNLKNLEKDTEYFMNILDSLNFDKLIDSKDMPYIKKPNDKLPKKVNLKIINDLDIKSSTLFDSDKQKKLNNDFIISYEKRTGINLNEDTEQRYFIFDILNKIKDLNNSMVDYYIYNDKCLVNLFNYFLKEFLNQDISFVKDITYINVFNKLKDISNLIDNDNIDLAFSNIKELIEQFKDLYERNS